ncbi:transketolase [Candidatus Peregrinibacteria bacterium HGW-Peregrinibacteria-1]|jgi:transketolase|nr:MAG: transketolase [Candidatus Peregrinibacteria bacterium HGW-Peregrinibacteria-1]
MDIPSFHSPLTDNQLNLAKTFAKSCRKSILEMVVNAQSGHPGGSLSTIDYLSILYPFIIGQTGESIIVSNGHISPAIYSTLAEMNYIPKQEVISTFRQINSPYEGHINRHVPGIEYGTGPLGIGVSVASAFATSEKLQGTHQKIYAIMGDGECQEGQVHEMIHYAKHYKLDNLILFVDYNQVQLSGSIKEILNINVEKIFAAGDWNILNIDGHNYQEIWAALSTAQQSAAPTVIIGHTVMGKGVPFMEETGKNHQADWHGKAPAKDHPLLSQTLDHLTLDSKETATLQDFQNHSIKWTPTPHKSPEFLSQNPSINTGTPRRYDTTQLTDPRTAYGNALYDLATENPEVIALSADLKGSVKTDIVSQNLPSQHIECGISEQHMISLAGGLSIKGFVPFASTFGAFMTSRAKDQARVNDINQTNVKMVATHCGLSVGEDGPTHQAIDDKSSFVGFFNTAIIEPADPNQTDSIIRYIASHYGNFYVRMGRHKYPVITKENGEIFFDENYQFQYGKTDLIRNGHDLTILSSGATLYEALLAHQELQKLHPAKSIALINASTFNIFDETLLNSLRETKSLITVEDHNTKSGIFHQLAPLLITHNISLKKVSNLGVTAYQLSGTAQDLYAASEIDATAIIKHAALHLK